MSNTNPPLREHPPMEKTILIVEDDAAVGEFLIDAFNDQPPYHALLASDGFEALKILRTLKPNLLLLDYQLPEMNGLELYDQICRIEGLEGIPTLFMSANLPKLELKQRQLAYIEKPFEIEVLFQQIEPLLAR